MYNNLWNIGKAMSHYFSDCSSDQGTSKKAKWHLGSECPLSYSTLKASTVSRILTTTGALLDGSPWPVFEGEGLYGAVADAKITSLSKFQHFYAELSILPKCFSFCRSS